MESLLIVGERGPFNSREQNNPEDQGAELRKELRTKSEELERESSLGTLWDQEQCTQFCSKDELWEAAKEEEMKIPWKEVHEGLPVPEDQYQERFSGGEDWMELDWTQ